MNFIKQLVSDNCKIIAMDHKMSFIFDSELQFPYGVHSISPGVILLQFTCSRHTNMITWNVKASFSFHTLAQLCSCIEPSLAFATGPTSTHQRLTWFKL